MRYLSRVIKSSRVSLGKQMELDSPRIIKEYEEVVLEELPKEVVETKEEVEVENEKTKEEIEEMYIEEARKKSELFFEEEMKKAYDEGINKAKLEADEIISNAKLEAEKNINDSIQVKNSIAEDYKNAMKSMESDIVELVMEVSQKVVAKEIEKPDYIIGIVSEAIDKVASKKDTILKVSEKDYDYILESKEKILLNVEGFGDVEIMKESSLEPGSCLVESQFGIIDGSLKTRMSQIEKEVQRILNR